MSEWGPWGPIEWGPWRGDVRYGASVRWKLPRWGGNARAEVRYYAQRRDLYEVVRKVVARHIGADDA